MPLDAVTQPQYHIRRPDWIVSPSGDPRGYIQPDILTELWFHTGTACNLRCPFCFEGSKPGDNRLEQIGFDEAKPFVDEALELGVQKFSFTGGEPFVNRDFLRLLGYALDRKPCMVLSNGTKPLQQRMEEVLALRGKPHPLKFRISFDFPDPEAHDAQRGAGNFMRSLESLGLLHNHGFPVSIARLGAKDENGAAVNAAYRGWFRKAGVPEDIHIVVFPDFYTPGAHPTGLPQITEHCMTTYHTVESRAAFMCNFSKMVLKRNGRMRVYACTLVDDDEDYDLGGSLMEAQPVRVMLRHHRCFACFSCGASCSEP